MLLPSAMTLKVMIPRSLTDELQMSKHIDTSVCALFDGVRFHGEVTKVICHDVHDTPNVCITSSSLMVTNKIIGAMN